MDPLQPGPPQVEQLRTPQPPHWLEGDPHKIPLRISASSSNCLNFSLISINVWLFSLCFWSTDGGPASNISVWFLLSFTMSIISRDLFTFFWASLDLIWFFKISWKAPRISDRKIFSTSDLSCVPFLRSFDSLSRSRSISTFASSVRLSVVLTSLLSFSTLSWISCKWLFIVSSCFSIASVSFSVVICLCRISSTFLSFSSSLLSSKS